MKIYTKKGDKGKTSLLKGKRVLKNHPRIETYGTIDELNSFLGLIRNFNISEKISQDLLKFEKQLMLICSHIANEDKKIVLNNISENDIIYIEKSIDELSVNLPVLKQFIVIGGDQTSSFCNVARCVCRRAERFLVSLAEQTEVEEIHIKYLNRLSDYLFVLGRFALKNNNIDEIYWDGK